MADLAEELAALVADTLAAAESWRATGAVVTPTGALEGLPPAEPWPAQMPSRSPQRPSSAGSMPSTSAGPSPAGPSSGFVRPPPSRPEPARREPPRPEPVRAEPVRPARDLPLPERREPARDLPLPERREPARVDAPRAPTQPDPAPAQQPAGGGLAGLFGAKWQVALRDRGAEITTLLADLPPCPDCGTVPATLRGAGNVDARLVVVAAGPGGAPLGADGGGMLDRMLVNVLAVERGDVWLLEANPCAARGGACRLPLRRQVDVVGPRLVLAMGPTAGTVLGGVPPIRGEWTPWGDADVMTTFHPVELQQRPADKRPAMEHLTMVRRRM